MAKPFTLRPGQIRRLAGHEDAAAVFPDVGQWPQVIQALARYALQQNAERGRELRAAAEPD